MKYQRNLSRTDQNRLYKVKRKKDLEFEKSLLLFDIKTYEYKLKTIKLEFYFPIILSIVLLIGVNTLMLLNHIDYGFVLFIDILLPILIFLNFKQFKKKKIQYNEEIKKINERYEKIN